MSKGNTFENDILKLILQAVVIANIAQDNGTGPLTVLWISLHTSTGPGEAGNQTTNEATYTGYGRVSVARSASGFNVSNNIGSNKNAVTFGECTAGEGTVETLTYFGVGTAETSTGKLLYNGVISSPSGGLPIVLGTIPEFAADQLTITED
jgi:hypothetical protein